MSATNRGAVRREADFYATPVEAVYSFLDSYDGIRPEDSILEPSAGNGNIIKALRSRGYENYISAVELREEEAVHLVGLADHIYIGDFLDGNTVGQFDVIIGNPPYSMAQEFIDKALSLLAPGGKLIFLLRTNFLESNKRFAWWKDKTPNGLYVLHKRPSFTGKGTDATSYSWFVWERQTDRQTDNTDYLRGASL